MAEGLILGIDVGTTSVKAGLVAPDGVIVARFGESYGTARPENGRAEQNPDDWMRLIDKAIAQFVGDGFGPQITAIGLCSQVNTHVFVDAQGAPLMPAILWQDGRAAAQGARLDAEVSVAQKMAWWGALMPIDASNVLSRMAWVAETRPDFWDQTKWVMLPKDYCLFKLTGEVTTDPLSNIGLVGADLSYIPGVFDLVPGARDKLAPLVPVTQTAGRMRAGSPLAGVRVASGTMDAWAGMIGTGGARASTGTGAGASVYLSGTSEILGISSDTIVPTAGAIVFPKAEGLRIHAAPTQSGGDAQLWFSDLAGLSPAQMGALVAETPRSVATPLFLPQLEGERAPLWDTNLRAAFLRVSRRTGLGDMARAVYEGVAFAASHALDTLRQSAATHSDTIACAGGGFRSDSWNQIRADVLGLECHLLAAQEPGVLGAAMIAGVGTGQFADLAQADEGLVRYDRVICPDQHAHQAYRAIFDIYKDAISSQADITNRLREADAIRHGPPQ